MNMVYIELRKQLKGFDKSKKGLLQLHMLHNVELWGNIRNDKDVRKTFLLLMPSEPGYKKYAVVSVLSS